MTAAAPAINSAPAFPIAQDRATSLLRWNAVLAVLHAVQGMIILSSPSTSSPSR